MDLSDSSWIYSSGNWMMFELLPPTILNQKIIFILTKICQDSQIIVMINDYCGLMTDFSDMTALKSTSVGSRKAFVIGNNNLVMTLQRRFTLDYNAPITFIESSQLCRFQQCGRGSVVVFRLLSSTNWKLGIVKSISL